MLLNVMPLLFSSIGFPEILIIVLLVLIFFGGRKIPELMRGMGRGVKEFKDAVNKDYSKEDEGAADGKSDDAKSE